MQLYVPRLHWKLPCSACFRLKTSRHFSLTRLIGGAQFQWIATQNFRRQVGILLKMRHFNGISQKNPKNCLKTQISAVPIPSAGANRHGPFLVNVVPREVASCSEGTHYLLPVRLGLLLHRGGTLRSCCHCRRRDDVGPVSFLLPYSFNFPHILWQMEFTARRAFGKYCPWGENGHKKQSNCGQKMN